MVSLNPVRARAVALVAAHALASGTMLVQAAPPSAAMQVAPATHTVAVGASASLASYDGVVQAVRETTIAAQVPGAVTALHVKAGDRVRAGQVLLRLDARAAEQTAAASAAQVQAARAAQDAAAREFDRQKKLFEKRYISEAALERAEAQYKAANAGAEAQLAAAGAARTQSGFYVVKAPYDGIIADVSAVLGDMAMPGRPLLTLYDPAALRVSVAVPQRVAAQLHGSPTLKVELAGAAPNASIVPTRWQLLPHVDPATHTMELRLDLPAGVGATPGMFARAQLPGEGTGQARLYVPAAAVVRRAELTGVYVLGDGNQPRLRQVRLGRSEGDRIEVLSGLSAGDRIVTDRHSLSGMR